MTNTHYELVTMTEREAVALIAAGTGLPVHFVVQCESPMSSHVLAATLGSEFTIITAGTHKNEIECLGRRISKTTTI